MTDQTNIDTSGSTVDTADKDNNKNVVDLQNKIDSAVQQRLAREKAQQKVLQEGWEQERKALVEENDFLKKQFTKKIDEQLSDLPASFRSLVSKLEIQDQIKWLEEYNADESNKPKTPEIPNFNKKQTNESGEPKHKPIGRII